MNEEGDIESEDPILISSLSCSARFIESLEELSALGKREHAWALLHTICGSFLCAASDKERKRFKLAISELIEEMGAELFEDELDYIDFRENQKEIND